MSGFQNKSVALAYVLCIASTLLCLIYGMANWNQGEDEVRDEDVRWLKEEDQIQDDL
jgi:hypothetical protein